MTLYMIRSEIYFTIGSSAIIKYRGYTYVYVRISGYNEIIRHNITHGPCWRTPRHIIVYMYDSRCFRHSGTIDCEFTIRSHNESIVSAADTL